MSLSSLLSTPQSLTLGKGTKTENFEDNYVAPSEYVYPITFPQIEMEMKVIQMNIY